MCGGRVIGSGRRRAPCNEIQTVAIYSTHFSTGRNRSWLLGKLEYKNGNQDTTKQAMHHIHRFLKVNASTIKPSFKFNFNISYAL